MYEQIFLFTKHMGPKPCLIMLDFTIILLLMNNKILNPV